MAVNGIRAVAPVGADEYIATCEYEFVIHLFSLQNMHNFHFNQK